MDLQELRTQIDRVDNNLLSLIIERRNLVQTVAEYKRDNQLPIFAPEREEQILKRLDEHGPHVHGIGGIRLLYGILMDLNTLSEYQTFPKDLPIPTRLGGASVRAILSDNPGALCRYLAPLAAAEISIADIRSQSMPGGKLLVDLELVGDSKNSDFSAALSVLSDTAEKFTLL